MTVHSASTTCSHTEAEVGEEAPALSASRVASSSQPVNAKALYEDPDLSPGLLRRHAASQARDALDDLVPVPSRTWRIRRAARDARGVLNHLRAPRRRSGQRTAAAPAQRRLSLPHVSIRVVSHLVLIVLAVGVALGGRKTLSPQPAAGQGEPEQNLPSAVQLESRPYSIYTSKGDQTREEMGALVLSPSLKQPAGGPAFPAMHTVEAGETLDDIATEYNVSKLSIAASNGLLKNRLLAIGQQLRIPALSGIPYTIQEGDSLEDIAKRHGVTLGAIVGYGPNGVAFGDSLPVGKEIFIPEGLPIVEGEQPEFASAELVASLEAVAVGTVLEDESNLRGGPGTRYDKVAKLNSGDRLKVIGQHTTKGDLWYKIQQSSGETAWMSSAVLSVPESVLANVPETNDFPPPPPIWVAPTWGSITSGFGYRVYPFRSYHNGVDIANDKWTPIVAARDGEVYEAGWCSGYGWCVKISHDSGFKTIYGHMAASPEVRVGDWVEAGQLIGYMGMSYDRAGGGYSTGVHLHFTLMRDGAELNPLRFIPW